ncbi:ATP-binding protein [Vogesella sp. LIG4]|uniref:ATP-binding protein n=1 Tax=Vogesella sp. LIG4 TaxID=1192162 RepID=UPI0008200DDB|nr:ATP-binding protein [Vogesella sp. LIG4]SCK14992.1 two-component system, OmpR family, sensor histidine kinase RstB [Vogesella sp. LIG4]
MKPLPGLAPLFARYFVQTMVVQFVLLLGFVGLLILLTSGAERDRIELQMAGPVRMIQRQLLSQPPAARATELHTIAELYAYPLQLLPATPAGLSDDARAWLASGNNWLDADRKLLYAPLPGTRQVLLLGPLEDSLEQGWLHSEAGLFLLWFGFFGVPMALLIYLNLRPHWQALKALRFTATQLAEGDLSARAANVKSPMFGPLAELINDMASKLERQMETRQALAHAVAHELRTPVARLRFGLTMLDEAEDEHERHQFREGMERDLTELDELLNISLSYARLDRGEVALQYETIDLTEWFEDLIQLLHPLKPPHISLTLDCMAGSATFDRKLMYVATRNLLLNAFKYAAGKVHMQVWLADGQLHIDVDDDGPGIPADERDRVFEPFQRLDRSRDRATGGHGLGLSFVRLITLHHGGAASAGEARPLGGARMTIQLPQHPPAP